MSSSLEASVDTPPTTNEEGKTPNTPWDDFIETAFRDANQQQAAAKRPKNYRGFEPEFLTTVRRIEIAFGYEPGDLSRSTGEEVEKIIGCTLGEYKSRIEEREAAQQVSVSDNSVAKEADTPVTLASPGKRRRLTLRIPIPSPRDTIKVGVAAIGASLLAAVTWLSGADKNAGMHITKVQDGIAALFNGSGKSLDSNWRSTVLTRWERIAASPTPTTDLRDFLQLLASHKDLNTDEIGATPDALRATAERSIASDITRIQEILSGQPSVDELLDAHRTWRDIQRVSSEMNLPSILQSAELNDLDQKFCNAATAAMRNAAATERNPTELAKLMRELTIIFNDGLMAKSQRSMQRASEAAPATTPGDSRIAYETNLH